MAVGFSVGSFRQYRAWLKDQARTPDISIWFGFIRDDTYTERLPDPATVEGLSFDLQVTVTNRGTAPLKAGSLNIIVLGECTIGLPDGEDGRNVHVFPGLYPNDTINGPDRHDIVPVRFADVSRDFVPNDYVYRVTITTPRPGTWPVLAVLDGEPPPRHTARVDITTGREPDSS